MAAAGAANMAAEVGRSGGPMPAQVRDCMQHNWGGASFGLIANNKVKSGGAQFWLGQGSQLIVEDNEFTGWGHVSGGNAIQTYRGGYSQH